MEKTNFHYANKNRIKLKVSLLPRNYIHTLQNLKAHGVGHKQWQQLTEPCDKLFANAVTAIFLTILTEDPHDIFLSWLFHAAIQRVGFVGVIAETFCDHFAIDCKENISRDKCSTAILVEYSESFTYSLQLSYGKRLAHAPNLRCCCSCVRH